MGIFSKKRDDEFFDIIESQAEDELFRGDDHAVLAEFASNALTPDEIVSPNHEAGEISASDENPLDALKKRMLEAGKSAENNGDAAAAHLPETLKEELQASQQPAGSEKKTELPEPPKAEENKPFSRPLRGETAAGKRVNPKNQENTEKTLLEKCMPYIVDDDGNEASPAAPLYTLESIADILRSDSEKTIDKLSQKYNLTFDDLGQPKKPQETSEKKLNVTKSIPETPPENKEKVFEKQIFEDIIRGKDLKSGNNSGITVISDIDNATDLKDEIVPEVSFNTGTVRFTPVKDSDADSGRIVVSTMTRPIDLTGEFTQVPEDKDEKEAETKLEETEFEEYIPKTEFSSFADGKRIHHRLSLKKRGAFLSLCVSLLFTVCLAAFKLPFLSGLLINNVSAAMTVCTVILGIIIAANYELFTSFSKMFSRRGSPDVNAAFAVIAVAVYTGYSLYKKESAHDLMLLLGIILSARAAGRFMKQSYLLSNLSVILTSTQKRAVKLIDDPAVCFAMAKNAVEGDALIAAPQYTTHIDSYMKYSTFGVATGGKLPVITAVSLILSAVIGFSCAAYFEGVIYGLYGSAALLCLTALPPLFFVDNLPLYSAAKKLNRRGAMISGKMGAERIEQANAIVLSSEDLFPSGAVTMHNMKVLSENIIDETILRAASLTETVNSPLAPIFKRIAGNSNITVFPDSDTVKYEDRMGLSGWVDNKLLFVGNRTLMEAHGIEVPDVEVDRKILRKGFFPVYLASEGKACALIVIQYRVNPEISLELSRLTALGVTVLVNNCDPNLTEEMICDYLGLYEDSVKVMSSAGAHMYKNAVNKVKSCTAPAAYKGSPVGFASIINCASRIRKSNILLTALYILAAIFGTVMFAYTSFAGTGRLADGAFILIYSVICTAVAAVTYIIEKP